MLGYEDAIKNLNYSTTVICKSIKSEVFYIKSSDFITRVNIY
jgi:hypothetical protein